METATEAGCPTGTENPEVSTLTEVEEQVNPAVPRLLLATWWASLRACPAVRARDAARAAALATPSTADSAIAMRYPAVANDSSRTIDETISSASTAGDPPRSSRAGKLVTG
jgi:hypothetical protein